MLETGGIYGPWLPLGPWDPLGWELEGGWGGAAGPPGVQGVDLSLGSHSYRCLSNCCMTTIFWQWSHLNGRYRHFVICVPSSAFAYSFFS